MRNEVLRMERVTYKEDEVVKLKDFNLQIFQGEVMGFLPVNSHGKTALLKLLERNLPLYDGYIYYTAVMAVSASAQTTQESKFFDNWYLGVNVGCA